MTDNTKIVRQMFDACMNKDFETARKLFHPQYTLKDPMMTLNGPDEVIEMMKNCPGGNRIENITMIAEGNRVVTIFDNIGTKPENYNVWMCDIATIEGGKIRSEEMFYDTAAFPKSMIEGMKKTMPQKNKAA